MNDAILKAQERAVLALRELYRSFGYSGFKMSKFERYDLYVENRDFLVSDRVITFTDTDGALMALKPDVTLSIVKNAPEDGSVLRVYYNENVYRVAARTNQFKELMQTGIECIGNLEVYHLCEVVSLAAGSLSTIAAGSVLAVSHLGIIDALLQDVTTVTRRAVMSALAAKNPHGMRQVCESAGMSEALCDTLVLLTDLYGTPAEVLPKLRALSDATQVQQAVQLLAQAVSVCEQGDARVVIDLSLVSDSGYYNGLIFRGYVRGIPTAVLFGGQYDRLLHRMGKPSRAIGFAVYLDELQLLVENEAEAVDVLVVRREGDDPKDVLRYAQTLARRGLRVVVDREDCQTKAARVAYVTGGEGDV